MRKFISGMVKLRFGISLLYLNIVIVNISGFWYNQEVVLCMKDAREI